MTIKYTTLRDHCARAGTPYRELTTAQHQGAVLKRSTDGNAALMNVGTPLIYCGQATEVHFYGRSFLHTKEGDIAHGQSYQNHGLDNFAAARAAFIDSRSDLFTESLGEECLFFGGMNIEQTPVGPSYDLPGAANFGHFIFEYLNRLAIFDMMGLLHLPVVVYDCLPKRYLKWIELLGVRKFLMIPPSGSAAFRKVWVTSAPHSRGQDARYRFWPGGLHWFRQMCYRAVGGPGGSNCAKRVYLDRGGAEWRHIRNHEQVQDLLRSYDFEWITMHTISPKQQIDMVSGAEIIVTAAGANTIMTHLAPENCAIIAMFPHPAMGTGLWGGLGAALAMGQYFDRIDGMAIDSADPRPNTAGADERADYIVDVGLLEKKIKQALDMIKHNQSRDPLSL